MYTNWNAILAITLVSSMGCVGQEAGEINPDASLALPTRAGQFGLTAPVDALALIPERTSSMPLLAQSGSAFEAGLAQRVADEGAGARFSPAWDSGLYVTNKRAG